jgi:hypothetical protein
MDECEIQLKEIKLYVNKQDVIQQCDTLLKSNQSRSIEYLTINGSDDIIFDEEPLALSTEMKALKIVRKMDHLSKIKVYPSLNQVSFVVLLYYLIQMPFLDTFIIHNTQIFSAQKIPEIPSPLPIRRLEINMLDIYDSKGFDILAKVMKDLLPKCPDLEHFTLKLDIEDVQLIRNEQNMFCFLLDFTNQTNLKTVCIDNTASTENHFNITNYAGDPRDMSTNNGNETCGDFVHDKTNNQFTKRDDNAFDGFYSTILLTRPTLLNSFLV